MADDALDFLVSRDDLSETTFEASEVLQDFEHGDAGVLLKVDQFALTANNITYAVAGDSMRYWQFFPAREAMGRVPVWGFADVLESNTAGIEVGERLYGYLPMSTHLIVSPERVTERGFVDGVAHRAALPPIYNQYTRLAQDPTYDPAAEAQQALFRPLFTTSFLLEDFLADNEFFGAGTVLLTSASSKTSFGLAHLLHENHADACRVVGLTGAANRAFVEGLGCYDQVVSYDELTSLTDEPAVVVDMAGNGQVLKALHFHFQDNMKYSCTVGATHWDQRRLGEDLPGAVPTLFFAPDHAQRRIKERGADNFQQSLESAWAGFMTAIGDGIEVIDARGRDAVAQTYAQMLAGKTSATRGYMLSLWPD
jgi:hypothetical protein